MNNTIESLPENIETYLNNILSKLQVIDKILNDTTKLDKGVVLIDYKKLNIKINEYIELLKTTLSKLSDGDKELFLFKLGIIISNFSKGLDLSEQNRDTSVRIWEITLLNVVEKYEKKKLNYLIDGCLLNVVEKYEKKIDSGSGNNVNYSVEEILDEDYGKEL